MKIIAYSARHAFGSVSAAVAVHVPGIGYTNVFFPDGEDATVYVPGARPSTRRRLTRKTLAREIVAFARANFDKGL